MKKRIRFIAAAALALAAVFVLSCEGPAGLLGDLETKVMAANAKFLEVTEVSPQDQADDVYPNEKIIIKFNRDLDKSTINENNIIVKKTEQEASVSWTHHYSPEMRTLEVSPTTPLESGKSYIIKIQGLKAKDGSPFNGIFSWVFSVKKAFWGYFWFGTVSQQENPLEYANIELDENRGEDKTVPVSIIVENVPLESPALYYLTEYEDEAINPISVIETKWILIESPTQPVEASYKFLDDGEKILYLLLKAETYAPYTFQRITVDRTPPNEPENLESFGDGKSTSTTFNSKLVWLSNSVTWSWGQPDEEGNKFRYAFNKEPSGEGGSTTEVTVDEEGDYTLNVQQGDAAGNWSESASSNAYLSPVVPFNGMTVDGWPGTSTNQSGGINYYLRWRRSSSDIGDEGEFYRIGILFQKDGPENDFCNPENPGSSEPLILRDGSYIFEWNDATGHHSIDRGKLPNFGFIVTHGSSKSVDQIKLLYGQNWSSNEPRKVKYLIDYVPLEDYNANGENDWINLHEIVHIIGDDWSETWP